MAPSASDVAAALPSLPAALPGSDSAAGQHGNTVVADAIGPEGAATAAAPAHQVSAAMLSLSRTADGTQSMTLRLEPAELGQVEIRIERPQDAPARVDIAVERPETMTLLLHDQPQLQHALDQAGVPADGRSLTLHLATPQTVAPSPGSHGGMAANAGSGQGNGGNGSAARPDGQANPDDPADAASDDPALPGQRWLRAGLDITA